MSKEKYIYVLPEGTVIRSQRHSYTIVGVLGQGGFGITYQVVNEYNQIIALKEHFVKNRCFRDENGTNMAFFDTAADEVKGSMKEFKREGELLMSISHQCPNIVRVFEVFEANNTAYYSMEYLAGGSLRDLVRAKGAQKEEVAKMLMNPIATALTYLHDKRYLHMDIKPDNIVMRVDPDSNVQTPVLIDFGVSLHFDDKDDLTTTHHIAGVTKGFSPIEQYEPINHFAPTVDLYALAATWFYLLAGHNPLPATDITPEWIQKELSDHVSHNTRNAIVEGMKFRAFERPKNINAFLRLMEENTPKPPEEEHSPLLKRIILAACIFATIAGIVLLCLNNCGGEKQKETIKELPPKDPVVLDSPRVEKTIVPRYYEMIDSNGKDTLYICLDSLNNKVSGCYHGSQNEFYVIFNDNLKSGNELMFFRSISKRESPNECYSGKLNQNLYEGRYPWKDIPFKFKVTEIDEETFDNKNKKPNPQIESPVVEEVENAKNETEEADSIINSPAEPPNDKNAPDTTKNITIEEILYGP